ncbi:MAG TPA: methyltransferase domain-containing protein [Solirubrobacteraceae bacterium]|nr:methyltransferase domain-containing protein [Solirubrobacteraceae bacterium]
MRSDLGATRLSHAVEGVPERFVPAEMHGELVEAEHVARYLWASAFCSGRRVLDAGCGVGYGTRLLAQAGAAEVVGLDVADAVIEVARNEQTAGVEFEVGDLRSLSHPAGSFDLVVCFEVIEHVDEQDRVLDELARVLRPDGLLLISSPNRGHYVPGNPHHRHEYVPAELRAALERRFPAVRLISQHVMLASVIGDSREQQFDHPRTERLVEPGAEDELYTLAIAGAQLPAQPEPLVALTQFVELRRWLERFQDQERVLGEQSRALRELELLRGERREALDRLAEREQELAELPVLRERLAQAKATVPPLQEQIAALQASNAELARSVRVVHDMCNSVSWRITAPLRAGKRMVGRLRGRAA